MIQLRHILTRIVPPRVAPAKRGFRALHVIAAVADATVEFALQGLLARFPGLGTPTALSTIGRDRVLPRGRNESDEAYAERLRAWRSAHRRAGNPYLIMQQLQASFAPVLRPFQIINSFSTWYTLNEDRSVGRALSPAWDWDGIAASVLKARFWLMLWSWGNTPFVRDGTWDSGDHLTWDESEDGTTWGSSATQDDIRDVFSVIEHWRSHGAKLEHVIVAWDALASLPDGTWGLNSGSRDPAAVYWRPESL